MKILVTGGAGFIGSHIVDSYIADGHTVVVIDNLSTGHIKDINNSAKFYLLDVRSKEVEKVFSIEKPDIVNHHAAQISVPASVDDPLSDADINIKGILNLLENSVHFGVKKFIFPSTGGAVYGETDNIPTPETERTEPLSPYAVAKLSSEDYIKFYKKQYDLTYTVLRYANVYGPRQTPHGEAGVVSIFMGLLRDSIVPKIYSYPESKNGMTRDYCYVGDVARANVLALSKGNGEVINIGTSIETATGALYRKLLESMREKGFAKDEKFDSPLTGVARPGDLHRSALNIDKAMEILEWSPKYDLKQGLCETVRHEVTNSGKHRAE